MVRIAGVTLPPEKRVEVAMTYIYGVGRQMSRKILKELNIHMDTKVKDLSDIDANKLRDYITKVPVEGDLRRKIQLDIKRLMEVSCYRGIRHKRKLPVRGQRTRKNARTRKGKRKTVANKKMVTK